MPIQPPLPIEDTMHQSWENEWKYNTLYPNQFASSHLNLAFVPLSTRQR